MSNTQLRDECINRPYLDALASTKVSPSSRFDVVVDLGCDDREQRKTFYDLAGCFRTVETLEQFLQDDSRRNDRVATGDGPLKKVDFWARRSVPPQRQRPDARVYENIQRRDRSFL